MRTLPLSLLLLIFLSLPHTASAEPSTPFAQKLAKAALDRTYQFVFYDPKYMKIPYPNGDVPANIGVCSDVVIRSYRALNIDLQRLVHEDMKRNFNLYPKNWGLTKPDTNIDHRRVPNLRVFFKRHGQSLPVTTNATDYKPGDIVTWNVNPKGNTPHIGIVSHKKSLFGGVPLIVHNIGLGPKLENALFRYKITGHYRFQP